MQTITVDDQIRILERFNEKVDRLKQRGFAEESRGGGAIVRWEKGQGWDGIHVGPRKRPSKRPFSHCDSLFRTTKARLCQT